MLEEGSLSLAITSVTDFAWKLEMAAGEDEVEERKRI